MQIFPTRYSLLSATALNDFLQEKYGYKNTTCRLLIHNVSDTYLIENKSEKYIFKIYRDAHRNLDEINGEIELLNILKAAGARVSYPVADLKGNFMQHLPAAEGTRNGVMFSFAPGKVVIGLNEEQIAITGREMAVIHDISSVIELQYPRKRYDANTMLSEPIRTIKPAFKDLPDEYNYLLETADKVSSKINAFDLSRFSYGYCHYDFLPKNFHFIEENQITFFDFDFAGKGLLANDIASFYVYFFLEVHQGKMTQQKADEQFALFIESYRTVRPFSDEELKSIPYIGFAFWIFYLGFQYDNFEDWSNMFFGPNFLKGRVALLKTWVDWYCKF